MSVNAPKEQAIIQSANQPTLKLHEGVSQDLVKAGHPTATPQSVNPHDQSHLENIRQTVSAMTKDPVRIVGGIVEEGLGGANPNTHVGTTGGKGPVSILLRKLRRAT